MRKFADFLVENEFAAEIWEIHDSDAEIQAFFRFVLINYEYRKTNNNLDNSVIV